MRARTRTIKIKKKIRKIKKQNKVGRRNAIERGATTIVAKIWLDCVSTGFLLFTEGEKGYIIVWLFFIIIRYFINNYEITVTLWRAGISDGRAASTTGPFFVRLCVWACCELRLHMHMLRILVPLNARRSSRRPLFSCFPTFESVPKLIPGWVLE